MANLTITIPNTLVPDLVVMCSSFLKNKNIDTTGMTNLQIGQRYMAEKMKDDYVLWTKQQADADQVQFIIDAQKTAHDNVQRATRDAALNSGGITG